ncbi:hypothetical protein [Lysobacter enzymogenes]|uniref:hypothetical protein n=1 Tax=Lysobacter enzymogenes TaxID=69 RepID=UPI001A963815|nr:hypothetical protein [Lysobacter enzymogenes]QQP97811.1 hypothetical protein JHW38_07310 [Lysobacter enzymogenes]
MAALKKMARSASESAPTKFTLPKETFSAKKSARIVAAKSAPTKTPAIPGPREPRRDGTANARCVRM